MLKLYEVEIRVTVVVCATDDADAEEVARDNAREIIQRESLNDISAQKEIKYADQLPPGWKVDDEPYGDDETPINDYLQARPPERDTRTIDMFNQENHHD